jgi:hypothetical protein
VDGSWTGGDGGGGDGVKQPVHLERSTQIASLNRQHERLLLSHRLW